MEKLLGEHRGLTCSDQALKLSRLMVRAETMHQRVMLLKILQVYRQKRNTIKYNKKIHKFAGIVIILLVYLPREGGCSNPLGPQKAFFIWCTPKTAKHSENSVTGFY